MDVPLTTQPSTVAPRRLKIRKATVRGCAEIQLRCQNSKAFSRERGIHSLRPPDERLLGPAGTPACLCSASVPHARRDRSGCSALTTATPSSSSSSSTTRSTACQVHLPQWRHVADSSQLAPNVDFWKFFWKYEPSERNLFLEISLEI